MTIFTKGTLFMLKKLILSVCCLVLFSSAAIANEGPQVIEKPKVLFTTNMGDIEVELYPQKAPITVANFLKYVNSGFYNNTIFHRVIPNFMIQGGGFTETMAQKETESAIKNEANNGLKNERGSISMARTSIVDSATSQFFINLKDNDFLNHGSRDFGYAVFGKVISGMDVVDKIAEVRTSIRSGAQDVPVKAIVIISAKEIK